jgi:tetrahydromethanopterin S-methyltransferase subunit D
VWLVGDGFQIQNQVVMMGQEEHYIQNVHIIVGLLGGTLGFSGSDGQHVNQTVIWLIVKSNSMNDI